MNTREKTLEFPIKTHVDEETDARIKYIAARKGLPPGVQIRKWILEGIERDEAIREKLAGTDLRFSVVQGGA